MLVMLRWTSIIFIVCTLLCPRTAESDSHRPDFDIEKFYSEFAGKSYALVIGNDEYKNWPELDNAVSDAKNISAELKRRGYSTMLLLNVGHEKLERALTSFYLRKDVDDKSRLLLWYAGHGGTTKNYSFLVPVNAPNKSSRAFKNKVLSLDRFKELSGKAEAKHVLVVFDSCFSGTIFSASRGVLGDPITEEVFEPVRQFITSGSADEEVKDNGNFAALFLSALHGETNADANDDGYLTGTELGAFLKSSHQKLGQNPHYGKLDAGNYKHGDFVFKVPIRTQPTVNKSNARQQAWRKRAWRLSYEIDRTMYVSGDGKLNVRLQPDPGADLLKAFVPGTALHVTGKVRNKDWYRVRLADGRTGFAWSTRLSRQKTEIREVDEVMFVTGESILNVRDRPGTGEKSNIIKVLKRDDRVEVTGIVVGKPWRRIALPGGKVGYVWLARLSYHIDDIRPVEIVAYVKGKSDLMVRQQAGQWSSKLGKLRPCAVVDVIGKVVNKEWYQINLGYGEVGYVWAKRLSEEGCAN